VISDNVRRTYTMEEERNRDKTPLVVEKEKRNTKYIVNLK
jgi:hypothetical protein